MALALVPKAMEETPEALLIVPIEVAFSAEIDFQPCAIENRAKAFESTPSAKDPSPAALAYGPTAVAVEPLALETSPSATQL